MYELGQIRGFSSNSFPSGLRYIVVEKIIDLNTDANVSCFYEVDASLFPDLVILSYDCCNVRTPAASS